MNKKTARIFVPLLIFTVVIALWVIRNLPQNEETLAHSENLAIPLYLNEVNLEEMKAHNMPIILDFGADDCEPCKEMKPVLVKLNQELQDKAVIVFADVWKKPELADGFPIQLIPTQFFIDAQGKPYKPSEKIANSIPNFTFFKAKGTDEIVYTTHVGGLTEEEMKLILVDMGAKL